ncbi:WD40/YVTN/BNR-like repeat-containing protein [Nocardioides dongxiaopingii]|uniref:WD40/YVTN/BNR-like repeat-containing protein n=1 Tax=Nocardioides sp. S-1144 TaxID=2582905 RepID=UPI0021CAFA56|nr:exo-alpha-sialidase [Nocardioides sp. S-1144]
MATVLMVGTRKGLWIATSDDARHDWDVTGPHHDMEEVYSCLVDTRGGGTPRLFAGASSPWLGPQVRWSDDLGATWQETPGGGIRFEPGDGATVERVWQLTPGTDPDVVWAGTEPGAVWRSEDRGRTFALVRGLWEHPHRTEWGAGYGGQAFHTILPHPTDHESITVAISSGGVYQSADGGASWTPRNQGLRAEFLPEGQQYPEFGQCVHKIARHPDRPERLFLQNHGGVYRSDDHAATWQSIAEGLPAEFGFPVVVDPHDPDTVYVFPLEGSGGRYPAGAHAAVWRSQDAGATWSALDDGLPDPCWVGVMRDAMVADDHHPTGLYVGARNGAVWASADAGTTWREVVANLPDVMAVRAASYPDGPSDPSTPRGRDDAGLGAAADAR